MDFFVGKTTFLCEFQYRNLHRLSEKIPPWSKEEDELLRDCMKDSKREGKWNDLAKELFHRSDKKILPLGQTMSRTLEQLFGSDKKA